MGKNKIPLNSLISDERKRQITLSKRKKGIFKKAQELSQMTGVDIAVVIINGDKSYNFANRNIDDILRQFNAKPQAHHIGEEIPMLSYPVHLPLDQNEIQTQFWSNNLE